jgi:serine protease
VIPPFSSLPCRARRSRAPRLQYALAFLITLLTSTLSTPSAQAGLNVIPPETDFGWTAPGYVPDELLVKFRDGVATAGAMKTIRAMGASPKRVLTPDGLIQVKLPPNASVSDAIVSFNALPDVEYAAANAYAHGFFVPNDPVIGKFDLAWNLRSVGAYGAWDVVTGDPSIVLASIDTGVAYEDHPIPSYELAHVTPGVTVYRQSPELPGPFLPGYDFVNNDDHPNDDNGHGTTTSTIAAGQANNLVGSAGIAFGVTILPVKVLLYDSSGEMAAIVQGIRYAADQGADIANLSLGFPPVGQLIQHGVTKEVIRDFFRPLKDAVRYAQARGVILVAAAGNFEYPELSLPAGYPGVISVAATGEDNQIASYSSWGRGLSFVAPGGDFTELNGDHVQDGVAVWSIKPYRPSEHDDNFANPDSFNVFFFFGTSGSAPHVSGAVALLMSLGVRNQGSIEEILRATAINPFGSKTNGPDPLYGGGLIQIDKAVQLAASRLSPTFALGARTGSGARTGPGARLVTENPSRGNAALALTMPREGSARVQLFDISGRLVRTLVDGRYPAGERLVRWDGKDDRGESVGSGVYFFRVTTPDGVETQRVAVLR